MRKDSRIFQELKRNLRLVIFLSVMMISILIAIFYENNIEINPLKVQLAHMEFSSSKEDLTIKNINYKIFIVNKSENNIEYKLTFIRRNSQVYPYINSIPKEYTTEPLEIGPKESKYLEIKDAYKSEDNNHTGGFYDKFYVKVILE